MNDADKIVALEKRLENMEAYIKDLQWNIEYKWRLDFMGQNSANMYRMIRGAYDR